jgi:hypothetical protein
MSSAIPGRIEPGETSITHREGAKFCVHHARYKRRWTRFFLCKSWVITVWCWNVIGPLEVNQQFQQRVALLRTMRCWWDAFAEVVSVAHMYLFYAGQLDAVKANSKRQLVLLRMRILRNTPRQIRMTSSTLANLMQ